LRIVDFSSYSSVKIGTKCEVKLINKIDDYSDYFIIGGANNLLVSPNPPKIAMLSKEFDYIKIENNKLIVGAATKSGKLFSFCKKHDIKNFELLSNLPGTIGGLIKMNAGLKSYEIFNNLISIKTKEGIIPKIDISYGYRNTDIKDVIYEATFNIEYGFNQELTEEFIKMRKNQPKNPSFGSCFKNPKDDYAGRLIEDVGLKGHKIGDVCFSQEHANFLVNLGNGTFDDAIKLINLAKEKVLKKHNILLEEEVIILCNKD
jgi:UDP-N-acetylmuramate dehydrogenase